MLAVFGFYQAMGLLNFQPLTADRVGVAATGPVGATVPEQESEPLVREAVGRSESAAEGGGAENAAARRGNDSVNDSAEQAAFPRPVVQRIFIASPPLQSRPIPRYPPPNFVPRQDRGLMASINR
jgi:hypothetical protein